MDVSSIRDEMAKKRLKEIPDEVFKKADEKFSEDEEPLIPVRSDLDLKGCYQENWLIITDKRLAVFSIIENKDRTDNKNKREIEYYDLLLSEVEDVSIKRYVGNAFLQIKTSDKTRNFLRFSLSYTQRFEWVSQRIKNLINPEEETEKLTESDMKEMTRERLEHEDRCPVCGRKLPSGMKVCPKCIDKQKIFKRMFSYLIPYWGRALVALLLLLAVSGLNQVYPLITRTLLDDVLVEQNYSLFYKLIGALVFIYIGKAIFIGIRTYFLEYVGYRLTMDLRSEVYSHLQKLSMNYYDTNRTGKIINRVSTDTGRLRRFMVEGIQQLLNNMFTVIVIISIMLSMNWQLALISLSPIPLVLVFTIIFRSKIHLVYHRIWRRLGDLKAIIGDTVPGVKVVKAFTKEEAEINRFDSQLNDLLGEEVNAAKIRSIFYPAMSISTSLGALIIWWYGGLRTMDEIITVGTLVAFTQYMAGFYQPVQALARLTGMYEEAITSAERVFNVLDMEPETDEYDQQNITKEPEELKGEVEFDNVTFQYEGEDENVLQNVNITVKPGQTIGLVGPTGAGKTTFVNLIPRFYEVTRGKIKLDGIDIRDYDLQWLRRQIGIVPQHPFLFYGTIAENIAYGIENPTKAEIIEAAKMANAHEFIMNFPMGYDTHVGERGIGLSGGERQRVSIARAILKNSRLMILDEATSSVDTETETKIQNAIDRLIEGRTTFIIAHRLSTLRNADKLVVIEDGEVVETGSHEELLEKEDGVFKKLWDMQTTVSTLDTE
ncbi:MAG: ABC transporter ATP-binding protein [bacterium]